jgi:predicted nucleic acid-binding Zn ribbon protein
MTYCSPSRDEVLQSPAERLRDELFRRVTPHVAGVDAIGGCFTAPASGRLPDARSLVATPDPAAAIGLLGASRQPV